MTRYWIAIACREHVKNGVKAGICQVCHGKPGPLRAMKANDWIIYYSPKERFNEPEPCQRFTAIGRITQDEPYQYKMSEDFIPWRRNVIFYPSSEVEIKPMIPELAFITNKKHWGAPFRRGVFSILQRDFSVIASKMGIKVE